MDIEKAKVISDKVIVLNNAQKRLVRFDDTKEWCDITITGEDGNEKGYSLVIGSAKNKKQVTAIREFIRERLLDDIHRLTIELKSL